jgi:DNA-directed RNA polymerase subunit RPC12/RpoP
MPTNLPKCIPPKTKVRCAKCGKKTTAGPEGLEAVEARAYDVPPSHGLVPVIPCPYCGADQWVIWERTHLIDYLGVILVLVFGIGVTLLLWLVIFKPM